MYHNKVEICGMNTSHLKILTDEEKRDLLQKTKAGDEKARGETLPPEKLAELADILYEMKRN